jgi:hypothetical protein
LVDHVVEEGNLAVGIGDDGELNLCRTDFVDVLDPFVVGAKIVGALLKGYISQCQVDYQWLKLTNPIILTPRFSNSSFSLAKAPSSVVQTGVKSAG